MEEQFSYWPELFFFALLYYSSLCATFAAAYNRIRPHMSEDKFVVFHDGFQMKVWKEFLTQNKFRNVMLDAHLYLMVAELDGCEQTVEGYRNYIREHFAKDFAEVQEYVPVICGEWCMFNSYAVGVDTHGGQSTLNGPDFSENTEKFTPDEKKEIYLSIVSEQLAAWKAGSGYFYWNYKLLLDTVNDPSWIGWDSWDLGKSVDQGMVSCGRLMG